MSGVSTEWNGDLVQAMIQANAPEALNHGAELLRGYSQPLAPIDTGILRATGQVTPATESNLESHVSYDTEYAARQHEELDWRHDEGQAKYLEQPLEDHRDEITQAIAARLGEGLQ
ncbi:hypothetical protein [Leucobacter sp.]